MSQFLRIKYHQFVEHCRQSGFLSACRFTLYKYEEAVPVEKDLSTLTPMKKTPNTSDLQVLELTPDNFAVLDLEYPLISRKIRAERYFHHGYRSFALVRGREVLGDLWYSRYGENGNGFHPHVRWFGLQLDEKDVYMFDMFMAPGERGKALTTFFLGSVLQELRTRGYRKAFGYFAAQNIPALWVHRLIGYKELPRFKVYRYFLYETARAKS